LNQYRLQISFSGGFLDGVLFFCSTSGNSLYEVLELPRTATPEDIKRSYRKVIVVLNIAWMYLTGAFGQIIAKLPITQVQEIAMCLNSYKVEVFWTVITICQQQQLFFVTSLG